MQKLDPNTDGKTMDIVADNIAKLKELFPEIVTEGKVDFEALTEVLGDYAEDREERYSFTWNGKSKARMLAQTPSNGTLRPCPEESVDFDSTQNLFIEGDNLEVLKLLQKGYYGKIKLIYIDPPYNTGGDFIYHDDFKDNIKNYLELTEQVDDSGRKLTTNPETSGRYHTDWLNMMYPRLMLARNLLDTDGSIFISIDDNEIPNIRKLCDEIFGAENFVTTLIWEKADSPRNSARQFSEDHDYITVYSKNPSWAPFKLERTEEANSIYNNPDNDPRGKWIAGDPFANKPYSKGEYSITGPTGRSFSPPPGRFWRVSEEKFWQLDADGRIWWGPSGNARPSIKRYLAEVSDLIPRTLLKKEDVGSNRTSKNEIRNLFKDTPSFDTPKPTGLMRRVLDVALGKNDGIVLDFFAGSGTIGHTIFAMNAEDLVQRRFILVQLPEKTKIDEFQTIAEISKERLRRAIHQIKSCQTIEATTEQLPLMDSSYQLDLGFKVFKLDSTNIKPWDVDFDNYENSLDGYISNIKPGRSEEDVLYEILLKYGLDLTLPIEERIIADKKVFIVGLGALVLCLADGITLDVVEGIADLKEELKPEVMRVVFKDNGFSGPDGDVIKTNAIQILRQHDITDVKSL